MNYELQFALRDRLQEPLLDEDVWDKVRGEIRNMIGEIEIDLIDAIQADLAEHIASEIGNAARRTITAFLEGDEASLKRYIAGYRSSRDPGGPFDLTLEITSEATLAKIVERHRDLITDQRIADLEAQRKALKDRLTLTEAQNRELRSEADDVNRLQGVITNLVSDKRKLEDDLFTAQQQIATLEGEAKKLEDGRFNAAGRAEVARMREVVSGLLAEKEKLADDLLDMKDRRHELALISAELRVVAEAAFTLAEANNETSELKAAAARALSNIRSDRHGVEETDGNDDG